MSTKLFREKSVEKISSPDELNTYIKVIPLHIWAVIIVFVIMLISLLSWIEIKNQTLYLVTAGESKDGMLTCYIVEEDYDDIVKAKDYINACTFIRNEKGEDYGELIGINDLPIQLNEDYDPYLFHLLDLHTSDWVYAVEWKTDLPDGIYPILIHGNNSRYSKDQ